MTEISASCNVTFVYIANFNLQVYMYMYFITCIYTLEPHKGGLAHARRKSQQSGAAVDLPPDVLRNSTVKKRGDKLHVSKDKDLQVLFDSYDPSEYMDSLG